MPDPISTAFLLKTLGPPVASAGINWLMNRITGSPQRKGYEQFINQQSPVLEQLRLQAMGKTSTASRFLESRLQQAARQARQAEAATSTRQGLGTQSAISRQRQIGVQTEQTLSDLLGQLQLGSQQQYGQLMGQIGGMKAGMAEAEMGAQQRMAATVGQVIENIMAEYNKEVEKTGQRDNWLETFLKKAFEGISETGYKNYVPSLPQAGVSRPQRPSSYWNAFPEQYSAETFNY